MSERRDLPVVTDPFVVSAAQLEQVQRELIERDVEVARLRKLNDDWCANAKAHLDEADAARKLARIADECRHYAERECDRLRARLAIVEPVYAAAKICTPRWKRFFGGRGMFEFRPDKDVQSLIDAVDAAEQKDNA